MKKTLLATTVAALTFAPAVFAENYQIEGGMHYNYVDLDGPGSPSSDNFGLDFTYHLEEVSTFGHPLKEAGFLERSTNVGASYNNWSGDGAKGNIFSLNGEAFIEDFYLSANVDINSWNSSFGKSAYGKSSTTDFGIKAGFLPTDGLLLTLGYDLEEKGTVKNGKLKNLGTISLGGKFVTPLEGEMALNLEGEIGFQDDKNDTVIYTLGGDFYFDRAISAGLWVSDSDASGAKTEAGVRGNFFITPLVSLNAHYTHNYGYSKNKAFGLGAKLRF